MWTSWKKWLTNKTVLGCVEIILILSKLVSSVGNQQSCCAFGGLIKRILLSKLHLVDMKVSEICRWYFVSSLFWLLQPRTKHFWSSEKNKTLFISFVVKSFQCNIPLTVKPFGGSLVILFTLLKGSLTLNTAMSKLYECGRWSLGYSWGENGETC